MEGLRTPIKKIKSVQEIRIPASPFMKKIGFGTGIAVYEMQRSPIFDRSNSPWAVKKLIQKHKNNKHLDNRLMEEADVLRRLNHPNIVGFRAFVKDSEGKNVLAMEECSSCLGDLIEERIEPYPSKMIEKVASDVAKALEYLHTDALLIHCDVKSFNILIKGDFLICKLCDFGVSLPVTSTGEIDSKKAGDDPEYIGTPAWCAPEILKCTQEITTKADIYAFGLVIWEMIALAPPIDEELVNNFSRSVAELDSAEASLNSSDLEISVRKRHPLPDLDSTEASLNSSDLEISIRKHHPLPDLDSTEASLNSSDLEISVRKRPPLPDFDLTEDYNSVLEIFYCCTEEDRNKRPTAKDLVNILTEASNDKHG